jgi:hypothetical protein
VASIWLISSVVDLRAFQPNYEWLKGHLLNRGGGAQHRLAESPAAADIILLVDEVLGTDHFYRRIRKDPAVRNFREKCFIFTTHDRVIPFFPGIYASLPKSSADFSRQRAGFYLPSEFNKHLKYGGEIDAGCDLLFSYVGRNDFKPERDWLLGLREGKGFVRDTFTGRGDAPAKFGLPEKNTHELYAAASRRSVFVLCPRGYGVCSIRLFETMMLGRVPVILSDDWTPPADVDWNGFSVCIRERGDPRLLERLQDLLPRAKEMGSLARQTWLKFFAGDAAVERIVGECLDLLATRTFPEKWARLRALRHQLHPYHLKRRIATSLSGFVYHNENR